MRVFFMINKRKSYLKIISAPVEIRSLLSQRLNQETL